MDAHYSENIFKKFLDSHDYKYQENYVVGTVENPKDVDFYVNANSCEVYIDVKEVRDSKKKILQNDAYLHIREDIRDLRRKFKSNRPDLPVILVSMNLSTNYFTGFSVAQALLGDTGVEYDPNTD